MNPELKQTKSPTWRELNMDTIPEAETILRGICKRPGMYVIPSRIDTVCAFIDGFDVGRAGTPLYGFREWLVIRMNGGNNLHWIGLVLQSTCPNTQLATMSQEDHTSAIQALGAIFEDFFSFKEENGQEVIFNNYNQWLLCQSWYKGSSKE